MKKLARWMSAGTVPFLFLGPPWPSSMGRDHINDCSDIARVLPAQPTKNRKIRSKERKEKKWWKRWKMEKTSLPPRMPGVSKLSLAPESVVPEVEM